VSADETGGAGTGDGGGNATGGGAGSSGTGGDTTGSGGGGSTDDTTAPTIVSVLPDDGAGGVAEDAQIIITFSEAMDKAATQQAYQSATAGLKASEVTFSWNADGTVLTITPNELLEYAAVTAPDADANEYAFSLSSVAADKAGNELEGADYSFTTLKRVTQTIVRDAVNTGTIRKYVSDATYHGGADSTVSCGYRGGASTAGYIRGFWSYGLAGSGIPAALTLEKATLELTFTDVMRTNSDDSVSNIGFPVMKKAFVSQVNYGVIGETDNSAELGSTYNSTVTLLTQGQVTAPGPKSIDVFDSVEAALSNRPETSTVQYTLQYGETAGDPELTEVTVKGSLKIVYLTE
jgi:hypothetical protein